MSEKAKTNLQFNELPEGTVTFLFTDIEASTLLLQQLGANRYGQVLADQRAILRVAFEKHSGSEIDTPGDAFFVAFPRATQAVSAAVEAQRGLAAHQWPEDVEVRVRMGLHTGEPLKAEEGYVGMDVHRAARIAHVGHGGQVLLSETTTALVKSELPEGVDLLDLGRHRLKDLRDPEHIRQLVIEGLPAEFPSLKSLEVELTVPLHNLPAPVSSFVGRGQELDEIASILEDQDIRLLNLVGPPGVGKTRLALESAMRRVANYADGVWLVELAPLEKAGDILPAMAAAIGVEVAQGSGINLESALETSLNRGPLLLVIDNCEHLLEGIAPLLGKLLRRCPQLSIVATSREWLRVTGEVAYPIPALDISGDGIDDPAQLAQCEAMLLFIERARAVQPGHSLTPENLGDVSRICHQLDGIPLAIELAAARLGVMSERELAERLAERFALLTSGGRDVLPKMRTLRASLEWSYELLDPLEQAVLDCLSVFRGGSALPEAQYVCEDEALDSWEILETLSSLIEKSLVLRKESSYGRTRYSTLESIAELGRQHLQEKGAWEYTRQRHAEAYYNLAEEAGEYLTIKDDAPWMERLVEDEANLMATLHYWNEMEDAEQIILFSWHLRNYYFHRSHLMAEVENLVQWALSSETNISATSHGLGLASLGWFSQVKAEYPASKAYFSDTRKIGSQEGDPYLQMQGFAGEAQIDFLIGDEESALRNTNQALKLADQLGDEEIPWYSNMYIIDTKPLQDRQEALLKVIEEAAIKANTNMLAWASHFLGLVKIDLGEYEAAEEFLWNGLQAWRRIKNRSFQCSNLMWIAEIYQYRGFYKRAADLLEDSIKLGKTTGMLNVQIWELLSKARLNFDRDDLLQAQYNLEELKPLDINNPDEKTNYLLISGRIAYVQGNLQQALEYLKTACDYGESYTRSYGLVSFFFSQATVYCLMAVVQHELGKDHAAAESFRNSLLSLSKEYEHDVLVDTLEWLAVYCADLGQWDVATRFVAAIDSLRQISGIVPPVPYRQRWGATRDRTKENLPEGDFTIAWEEASAIHHLSLPDYALEQIAKLNSDKLFETHARS